MLNCSSVSPRFRASDCETSAEGHVMKVDLDQAVRTAGLPLSLFFAFVRSTSGTDYRKSMLVYSCADVSAETFAAEGMSTVINAGD